MFEERNNFENYSVVRFTKISQTQRSAIQLDIRGRLLGCADTS